MVGLTADEKKLMERLARKAEEPDEPPMGKSVSFSIDLGDDKQIAKAIKLGLLNPFSDDEDEDKEDKEDEKDDAPKRGGYFRDK